MTMAEELENCDPCEEHMLITDEQFDFLVPFSPDVSRIVRKRTVQDTSYPKMSEDDAQPVGHTDRSPLSDKQLAEIFVEAGKVIQHIDSCMSPACDVTGAQMSNITPLVSKLSVTVESVATCSTNSPLVAGVNAPSCCKNITSIADTTLSVSRSEAVVTSNDTPSDANDSHVTSNSDCSMSSDTNDASTTRTPAARHFKEHLRPVARCEATMIVSPTCIVVKNVEDVSSKAPEKTLAASTNKTGLRRIPSLRRKLTPKVSENKSPHSAPTSTVASEVSHGAGMSKLLRVPSMRRKNVDETAQNEAKRKKPEADSVPAKCNSMLKRIPSLRKAVPKSAPIKSTSTTATRNNLAPPKIGQPKLEVPSCPPTSMISCGESGKPAKPQEHAEPQKTKLAVIKKPMSKLQLMRGQKVFRKGTATDTRQLARPTTADGVRTTGPMKAVLPVTRLTVPTATDIEVGHTTPVKQFDKLKQTIHGLLTPPRHSSSTSAASITPGVNKHLSMLPTPNKTSATPRSHTSTDSQSSVDSVWSTPSLKRSAVPAFNALIDINALDHSTPSCLKSHKPPVQNTPYNKENLSIWSPVPRPKPINLEHEAIRCTKHGMSQ